METVTHNRRSFLKMAGSALLLPAALLTPIESPAMRIEKKLSSSLPGNINANFYSETSGIHVPVEMNDFWQAPRELWLGRSSTGEQIKLTYFRDGQIDVDGYIYACHMLRDTKAGVSAQMDLRLLDLLRGIQGWLTYYNINEPIIINSGLRTPKTNGRIEGAVKNSMHIYGMAADIKIPGISTKYLFDLAKSFNIGGSGFYPNKRFVHIDVGKRRSWRGR